MTRVPQKRQRWVPRLRPAGCKPHLEDTPAPAADGEPAARHRQVPVAQPASLGAKPGSATGYFCDFGARNLASLSLCFFI